MLPNFNGDRRRLTVTLALTLLYVGVSATAHGQGSNTTRNTPSTASSSGIGIDRIDGANGTSSRDLRYDEPQNLRVMRQNARRDDIKKRMEENATRLLRLTAELRNDLQTREPTEADSKRLDEIAKLAHAVREQMKQ